jgi:hypothetical protein
MSTPRHLSAASALLFLSTAALAETPDLGRPATPEEIAVWDISHGEKGSGKPNDQLVGGLGTLTGDQTPVKTVGSFWPYATTLFDYVRRAMPFNAPRSLSNDEVYAVCAYILQLNGIIAENAVMDAQTLTKVQMPNRGGFVSFSGQK